ncbi:hypothetical protein [Halalkalibacter lacteus]|uniref:hypothetical protein n=1 Tax=Halalkalibacter lacteus TaxID=3090663 RepID=UPI002FCC4E61
MNKLPNSNNDTKEGRPSTPRWVKVSGIIILTLVLLFFTLKLTGIGGNHGPGRHIPGGESTEQPVPDNQTPAKNEKQGIHNDGDGSHKPTGGGH